MKTALFLALAFVSCAALAGEDQLKLKDGPGKDLVANRCAICHSVDYIQMNSVFLDRKGWEAEVNKMVHVMHAPIDKEDIPKIVDYLVANYGVEKK